MYANKFIAFEDCFSDVSIFKYKLKFIINYSRNHFDEDSTGKLNIISKSMPPTLGKMPKVGKYVKELILSLEKLEIRISVIFSCLCNF